MGLGPRTDRMLEVRDRDTEEILERQKMAEKEVR
jgi:hypothetical protein